MARRCSDLGQVQAGLFRASDTALAARLGHGRWCHVGLAGVKMALLKQGLE